jgi:uncharacterized protein (DUF302 family)
MKTRITSTRGKIMFLSLVSILFLGLPASARHKKNKSNANSSSMQMPMIKGRVMGMSKYNFDDTVGKVKDAISAHNMMVLFTADHQQMLSMVGVTTPPMETLEFFSPQYGKAIYEGDMAGALAIPLRIVIMQNDQGKVMYSYDKPSYLFARFSKLAGLGQQLDQVMDEIVSQVKAPMSM